MLKSSEFNLISIYLSANFINSKSVKMKKLIFTAITITTLFIGNKSFADEGMWLPLFIERLNYVDMQKMGCHLTAEEIYSINNSSLKDAIVHFGNGCTAEIVSKEGLLFTNHHCGFSSIQSHSSIEHDYLENGFWALKKSEELMNKGLTATVLIRIEDVTSKILAELNNKMSESTRDSIIRKVSAKLEAEATKNTIYNAKVRSFFAGNEFYLFVTETYKDVRLVGAPPSAIGKFGGDTDNWTWPRHTCDFSIFRIYTAPDGSPVEYSEKNVPLQPKKYLPVSLNGVKLGDFSMVMGYPGTTERFLTSYGVKFEEDLKDPAIVKIRGKKLSIIHEDMEASHEVRIKYASKYYASSNYWKFFIGQAKQLKKNNVYELKKEIENKLFSWINADPKRKEKYGDLFTSYNNSYEDLKKYFLPTTYFNEAILGGPEVVRFSNKLFNTNSPLYKHLKSDSSKAIIQKDISTLNDDIALFYKDYNLSTDKKLFSNLLKMFYEDIAKNQQPDIFKFIENNYKTSVNIDFEKYANDVYEKSIFVDESKLRNFLKDPNTKVLESDPIYVLMNSFYKNNDSLKAKLNIAQTKINACERLYTDGIRTMNTDKKYSPSANGTMRLTYGKVEDYDAADAIHYNFYTTLDGLMAKEDAEIEDYTIFPKLKELYNKKDFGRYSEKDGKLRTCFITNNDITGGNSGSPVLNGNGQLIGLAFDGNWESMCERIYFDPKVARCICVDIRYVLFIVDKLGGAKNIVDELTIVEGNKK